MYMSDITTIRVHEDTRDRLKRYGWMDETYDDLLNRLMDAYDTEGGRTGNSEQNDL